MKLPGPIRRTPELDRWLAFNEDGTLTVATGKVDIGQGLSTALAMIAAEELDVDLARIRVQTADTELTPNEFVTAGSMSIEDSGSAVRVASATAREMLLTLAAELLGVHAGTLSVEGGIISSSESNEQTDYWSLQGGHPFSARIVEMPVLKAAAAYRVVGHRQTRLDLPGKVRGNVAFVHDMRLPHMRHGALVKPPSPTARLIDAPERLPQEGLVVVRDGSFLGVVADTESNADSARSWLAARARWESTPLSPLPEGIPAHLRGNVSASLPIRDGAPVEEAPADPGPAPDDAQLTLESTYYRPYQMHGALGPSAAVAQFVNGVLTVYSHSQGVELLKLALADALELPAEQVHVIHAEGSGCYGHNGADDVAMDAALLAMAVEPEPVRVQWSRNDEHRSEPYGPAMLIDMRASLDSAGRIVDWRHETYGFTHIGRPRPTPGHCNLQSSWLRERPRTPATPRPALLPEVGNHRNLTPIYQFPRSHLVKHFVAESPLRTSSLRSLGAFANVFAIESFMDELCHAAGADPFEFRLAHLGDERAADVLKALRDRAPAALPGCGRGIALARYKNRQTWCAVLVDARVSDGAEVQLAQALIVADAGLVIDPDGLANQLEGGFVQAASWTLVEEVRWDADGITSIDWDSYPVLRFGHVPPISTYVLSRPHEPALGAGEASTGPTPAAIANAVFAATGIRARRVPLTPENLRRAAAEG